MENVNTELLFKDSRKKKNETNDCVVRALAVAFNMTYEQSHAYCEHILKRKHRKGVYTVTEFDGEDFLSSITKPMVFNKRYLGWCKHNKVSDFTQVDGVTRTGLHLSKFKNIYRRGTYFILSSGHAYCVKDGVVYGNPNDDRTYVKLAYRIDGDIEEAKQNAGWVYKSLIFKK